VNIHDEKDYSGRVNIRDDDYAQEKEVLWHAKTFPLLIQ